MLQEVYLEHPSRQLYLLVVDPAGKSVLRLHLQLNEPPPEGHKFCPLVSVVVGPDEQFQSSLSTLLPPSVDENLPLDV